MFLIHLFLFVSYFSSRNRPVIIGQFILQLYLVLVQQLNRMQNLRNLFLQIYNIPLVFNQASIFEFFYQLTCNLRAVSKKNIFMMAKFQEYHAKLYFLVFKDRFVPIQEFETVFRIFFMFIIALFSLLLFLYVFTGVEASVQQSQKLIFSIIFNKLTF